MHVISVSLQSRQRRFENLLKEHLQHAEELLNRFAQLLRKNPLVVGGAFGRRAQRRRPRQRDLRKMPECAFQPVQWRVSTPPRD
jgi:hypothetical protein